MEALSRCVGVLTASSKPDDMAVQVNVKLCPHLQMISVLLVDVSVFSLLYRFAGISVNATV